MCAAHQPNWNSQVESPSAVLFTNDSFGIEERQMDFVSRVYRRE